MVERVRGGAVAADSREGGPRDGGRGGHSGGQAQAVRLEGGVGDDDAAGVGGFVRQRRVLVSAKERKSSPIVKSTRLRNANRPDLATLRLESSAGSSVDKEVKLVGRVREGVGGRERCREGADVVDPVGWVLPARHHHDLVILIRLKGQG